MASSSIWPAARCSLGKPIRAGKPTYSTCIGLILKGYDDYEHNRKEFEKEYKKVEVPDGLKRSAEEEEEVYEEQGDTATSVKVRQRRGLSNFWGKFKDGIIDLFKEEEDKHL